MTTSPTASAVADAAADTGVTTVLIADKFQPSGLEGLKKLGCEVTCDPAITAETLAGALREIDPAVLIVRSTKVFPEAIEAATGLGLIVRAGAGYDNIDVAAASKRGIFVANCPGKNAIAVAELAIGLMIACDRRVPDQTIELRAGAWNKKKYADARGLYGRTLGIVGLGLIGQETAIRAKAFGMNVVAWSRSLTEPRAARLGVGYCSSLINLAKMADVVSVHVAATGDTQNLIDATFLGAMKDGAIFINTSRGSVVDSEALTAAIPQKHLRVGLDVYANQPAPTDSAFNDAIAQIEHVYGTHHCGASTDQAQEATAEEAVRIVESYMRTGEVPNCVNRAASTPATRLLTVRHMNRPGVLAHVFYTLGQAGINVEEMENIIYDGAHAACARIQLDDVPSDEHLDSMRQNDNILSISLTVIEPKKP